MTNIETLIKETRQHNQRIGEVKPNFAEDVTRLYRTFAGMSGASEICRDILRIIHNKRGTIDPTEMYRLDFDNKKSALRLIALATSPSALSDDGLFGILTNNQIQRLLSD